MLVNSDQSGGSAAATPQLRLAHFSHERFHEQFRRDLQEAGERVILFSPFLAQNRVNYYHDLLARLASRGVTVDVYAKPKHEQPENLQHQFDAVSRRLTLASVHLHMRPLMHEKIAIVDESILWHGSLNILSHSGTSESMLRFESADLVNHLLVDLGLLPDSDDETCVCEDTQSDMQAPTCPLCASSMRLYENAGLWICVSSPACTGTLPVSGEKIAGASAVETLSLPCPLCASPLQVHRGATTRLECSSHSCEFSIDPRVTRGILRVLRQRNTA
jgi:ribosomal protein L37AE/L43A